MISFKDVKRENILHGGCLKLISWAVPVVILGMGC